MSNLRSWTAINNTVLSDPKNTLVIFEWSNVEYFTKLEDKLKVLENCLNDEDTIVCIIRIWTTRSDMFKLSQDDILRLLNQKPINEN